MAVLKTLNLGQAKEIFERETVLFENSDGVPVYRAKELLGADAVNLALKYGKDGRDYNSWGIGDYDLGYLTISGFLTAATHANVMAIREMEKEKAAASIG